MFSTSTIKPVITANTDPLGLSDMRVSVVLGRRGLLAKRIVRRSDDAGVRFDHLAAVERIARHSAGA